MRQVSIIVVVALGLFIATTQQAHAQGSEEERRARRLSENPFYTAAGQGADSNQEEERKIAIQLNENSLYSPGRNFDPNLGKDSWRFIAHIGWRKFAPNDVFYKDWRDYTRWSRFRPFPYWPY